MYAIPPKLHSSPVFWCIPASALLLTCRPIASHQPFQEYTAYTVSQYTFNIDHNEGRRSSDSWPQRHRRRDSSTGNPRACKWSLVWSMGADGVSLQRQTMEYWSSVLTNESCSQMGDARRVQSACRAQRISHSDISDHPIDALQLGHGCVSSFDGHHCRWESPAHLTALAGLQAPEGWPQSTLSKRAGRTQLYS